MVPLVARRHTSGSATTHEYGTCVALGWEGALLSSTASRSAGLAHMPSTGVAGKHAPGLPTPGGSAAVSGTVTSRLQTGMVQASMATHGKHTPPHPPFPPTRFRKRRDCRARLWRVGPARARLGDVSPMPISCRTRAGPGPYSLSPFSSAAFFRRSARCSPRKLSAWWYSRHGFPPER